MVYMSLLYSNNGFRLCHQCIVTFTLLADNSQLNPLLVNFKYYSISLYINVAFIFLIFINIVHLSIVHFAVLFTLLTFTSDLLPLAPERKKVHNNALPSIPSHHFLLLSLVLSSCKSSRSQASTSNLFYFLVHFHPMLHNLDEVILFKSWILSAPNMHCYCEQIILFGIHLAKMHFSRCLIIFLGVLWQNLFLP